ncbi:hypothetical protein ADENT20671_0295 [Actinomyces denticolens]|nr:hypothetical protein ADENT20671_0295 [Actinomyces denticolens]
MVKRPGACLQPPTLCGNRVTTNPVKKSRSTEHGLLAGVRSVGAHGAISGAFRTERCRLHPLVRPARTSGCKQRHSVGAAPFEDEAGPLLDSRVELGGVPPGGLVAPPTPALPAPPNPALPHLAPGRRA